MFRITRFLLFLCLPTSSVYALNSIEHDAYIVGDATSFWTTLSIPVCWENPENYTDQQLGVVRLAIDKTWAKHSSLKFTGWGKCNPNSQGIHIYADPRGHPHVRTFGRFLNGIENGIVLNFDYVGDFRCSREKSECDRIIAVHEFGHALGFHHEQNRSDTIANNIPCYDQHYQGQVPHEIKITKWDLSSVMNYCNPNWAGNGYLSDLDVQGVKSVYGGVDVDAKWSGTWITETYNERVNQKFTYEMKLTQNSKIIRGTYKSIDGNQFTGVITGKEVNGVLEGFWYRTDSGAPQKAKGAFLFVSKLDSEFSGHYSQGAWSGYKVKETGRTDVSGNWNSETYNSIQNKRHTYEIRFEQAGASVEGKYSNSTGSIRGEIVGEINGNVLRGTFLNAVSKASGDITLRFTSSSSFEGVYSQGTWIGSR